MTLTPLRRREAEVIAAIAALYLLLWLFLPKPSFWGIDNGIKFEGMRAFAETGSIVIPDAGTQLGVRPEFRSIPLPFGIPKHGGQLPTFSPSFIVLGGVLYFILGAWGPFLLPLIGGWGTLLAAWMLWQRHRESHDGRLYLILVGLASPLMFYSLELWEHSLATAFVVFSFAVLCSGRKHDFDPRNREGAFLSGLLIGFAAILRTECAIWIGIVILLWSFTGRSRATSMSFFGGCLASGLVGGAINLWQTGAFMPLGLEANLIASRHNNFFDFVVSRAWNGYSIFIEGFSSNYMSLLGLIPLFGLALWDGWRREHDLWHYFAAFIAVSEIAYLVMAIRAPDLAGYTSESGGILWVMPISALALKPLKGERRRIWTLLWAGWGLFFVGIALFGPHLDGAHWGPRFGLTALPLLLLLVVTRAQRWWQRYPSTKPIIILLVAFSIVNQAYGYRVQYSQRHYNQALNQWVSQTGSEPVVTKLWWVGGDAALASYGHPWFLVKHSGGVSDVIEALRKSGLGRFNYIEYPPYVPDEKWWQAGVTPVGKDYFLKKDGTLRRTWLNITPSGQTTSTAP